MQIPFQFATTLLYWYFELHGGAGVDYSTLTGGYSSGLNVHRPSAFNSLFQFQIKLFEAFKALAQFPVIAC